MKNALLIGNTSGIGAEVTIKLLKQNYQVIGISRSESIVTHSNYKHFVQDVSHNDYIKTLQEALSKLQEIDLCIYFAGIGEKIDWNNLTNETKVFEINLMSAVITTEVVLTKMLNQSKGHFIGLSSVADNLISNETPSYSASKSGVSKFWEGLGLGIKDKNVKISNIRFGFVDTKMAKSPIRPFLLSVESAAQFILEVIEKPRIRATKPKAILPLVWLAGLPNRIDLLFK